MNRFQQILIFCKNLGNVTRLIAIVQFDQISKIVKSNQQNVHELHQCNYSGLFINQGLLGGSFWQKVYFLVKMDFGNQLSDVPLILTENKKFLKTVHRVFMKQIKVIIRVYLSIFGYQMDYIVKKSTFWSKWPLEISLVVSP